MNDCGSRGRPPGPPFHAFKGPPRRPPVKKDGAPPPGRIWTEDGCLRHRTEGSLGEGGTLAVLLYLLGGSPAGSRLAGWLVGAWRRLRPRCEICGTNVGLARSSVVRQLAYKMPDGAARKRVMAYGCWTCADCMREGCQDGSGA